MLRLRGREWTGGEEVEAKLAAGKVEGLERNGVMGGGVTGGERGMGQKGMERTERRYEWRREEKTERDERKTTGEERISGGGVTEVNQDKVIRTVIRQERV